MKNLAIAAALLSAVLFTLEANAEPPGKGGSGKRGAGQGQKGGFGGGTGQARGQRPGGGQGRPGAGMDPAQMVARMMQQFDKDGDKKLDLTELTALLTEMRNRRGGMQRGGRGGPGAGQGRSRDGQGRPAGGKGRRGGGAEGQNDIGGAKPKRPAIE